MAVRSDQTIFDINGVEELTLEILQTAIEDSLSLVTDKPIDDITNHFMTNSDHGFDHSQSVWQRCLQIISNDPLVWRLAKDQVGGEKNALQILILASIFHDISRFWGDNFTFHEQQSAELVRKIVEGSSIEDALYNTIIHHDYFSRLVDGCGMPHQVMLPLSEIFRLADKTSISPADEIIRYHKTGKRLKPEYPVFDPSIPDDVRFELSSNHIKRTDELTWFLFLFALQSTNFVYGDTRDDYALWSRGKGEALEVVGDLCFEEHLDGKTPTDPEEAKQVIIRFCKKNKLVFLC